MKFTLYDYENEEYITPNTNIDGIIKYINTIYFYEADFIEVNEKTL